MRGQRGMTACYRARSENANLAPLIDRARSENANLAPLIPAEEAGPAIALVLHHVKRNRVKWDA
jgi:hypothetical protein